MNNAQAISDANLSTDRPTLGFVDRWGAFPFLCWLAIVGMPLQRNLEVSRQLPIADIYTSTLAITSEAASMNSRPFVLYLGGVYFFAGLMVARKPKAALLMLLRQWPLALLILFVVISVTWSPNRAKVALYIAHTFGATLLALAAALRYRAEPWLLPKHIGYVLGLNIVVQLASLYFLSAYTIEWEGRWRGLTAQANELGGISFCAFWANAALLIGRKTQRYPVHFFFAACAAVAMIGADSMTSVITSIAMLMMIFVINSTNRYRIGKRMLIGALGMVILLAIVGLVLFANDMNLATLLAPTGRSADFTGRTDIWMAAIDAISKSPWVGWGFDDNAYLIKTTGMPYGHYHNGYLDLLVRGGIVSLGLFILIVVHWLHQLTKRSRIAGGIVSFSMPFVIAMLIYNLTEVNFAAPRNLMWLIFLVILFLGGCKKWSALPAVDHHKLRARQMPPATIQSPVYIHSLQK